MITKKCGLQVQWSQLKSIFSIQSNCFGYENWYALQSVSFFCFSSLWLYYYESACVLFGDCGDKTAIVELFELLAGFVHFPSIKNANKCAWITQAIKSGHINCLTMSYAFSVTKNWKIILNEKKTTKINKYRRRSVKNINSQFKRCILPIQLTLDGWAVHLVCANFYLSNASARANFFFRPHLISMAMARSIRQPFFIELFKSILIACGKSSRCVWINYQLARRDAFVKCICAAVPR